MARGARESVVEQWRERLLRWRGSGQSVREFCRRERVSQPSFYQWRRKLTGTPLADGSASRNRFVPVQVVDEASGADDSGGWQGSVRSAPAAAVEITLPGGTTVRTGALVDESQLRSVLRAVLAETRGC
jgi:transposase-like protein